MDDTMSWKRSVVPRPYEMTFLNGRERRHDACRDGRRDDTERRNGKEDEECDETSYQLIRRHRCGTHIDGT